MLNIQSNKTETSEDELEKKRATLVKSNWKVGTKLTLFAQIYLVLKS